MKEVTIKNSASNLFIYLLFLTGIFFFIEISFFLQSSGLYFSDFNYITKHLYIPFAIAPGILFYLFAQLLLHFAFTLIVWFNARLMGYAINLPWRKTQNLGFYLWGIFLAFFIFANAYCFPNSKFTTLLAVGFNAQAVKVIFYLLASLVALMFTSTLIGLIKFLIKHPAKSKKAGIVLCFVTSAFLVIHASQPVVWPKDAASKSKPNIIIVGIDSLRPDYMNYLGEHLNTPNLNNFFDNSVVFAEAVTPIARTFPSWVSLLTGNYPKNNGVRFDLMEQHQLDLSQTLPAILKNNGYETIYAIDESRFSNIDKNFGFNKIISPPVGLNDFLLGTFNDFPFSNLFVNTIIGKWLFPYSYGNRAAFITYKPNSFLKILKSGLPLQRDKPLFLAVHFCLPHFPYLWADYVPHKSKNGLDYYLASIEKADRQFKNFLNLLKSQKLLEHSIVILISDHGESLELAGDRITANENYISSSKKINFPHFYPPSLEDEQVNEAVGHGTDVLSLAQYRTVLAFRLYGMQPIKPKLVSGVVTLMDIKPTLLSFLNIPARRTDGTSLRASIESQQIPSNHHHIFIESDFSPQAIHSVHPETREMLFEGIDFFQIDPVTTRLTVKPEMAKLIISSKQFADIYGNWILALYPNDKGKMTPILVNLINGKWTNDMSSSFFLNSPAFEMLNALQKFYRNELKPIQKA